MEDQFFNLIIQTNILLNTSNNITEQERIDLLYSLLNPYTAIFQIPLKEDSKKFSEILSCIRNTMKLIQSAIYFCSKKENSDKITKLLLLFLNNETFLQHLISDFSYLTNAYLFCNIKINDFIPLSEYIISYFSNPIFCKSFELLDGFNSIYNILIDSKKSQIVQTVVHSMIPTLKYYFSEESSFNQFIQKGMDILLVIPYSNSSATFTLFYNILITRKSKIMENFIEEKFDLVNEYIKSEKEGNLLFIYSIFFDLIHIPEQIQSLNFLLVKLIDLINTSNEFKLVKKSALNTLKLFLSNFTDHFPLELNLIYSICHQIDHHDIQSILAFLDIIKYISGHFSMNLIILSATIQPFISKENMIKYDFSDVFQILDQLGDSFQQVATSFILPLFNHSQPEEILQLFLKYPLFLELFPAAFLVNKISNNEILFFKLFMNSQIYKFKQDEFFTAFKKIVHNNSFFEKIFPHLNEIEDVDVFFEFYGLCLRNDFELRNSILPNLDLEKVLNNMKDSEKFLNFVSCLASTKFSEKLDQIVFDIFEKNNYFNKTEEQIQKVAFGRLQSENFENSILVLPSILSYCNSFSLINESDLYLASKYTLKKFIEKKNSIQQFPLIEQISKRYIEPEYLFELMACDIKNFVSREFDCIPLFEFTKKIDHTTFSIEINSETFSVSIWFYFPKLFNQIIMNISNSIIEINENGSILFDKEKIGEYQINQWLNFIFCLDLTSFEIYLNSNLVKNLSILPKTVNLGSNDENQETWYIGGYIKSFSEKLDQISIKNLFNEGVNHHRKIQKNQKPFITANTFKNIESNLRLVPSQPFVLLLANYLGPNNFLNQILLNDSFFELYVNYSKLYFDYNYHDFALNLSVLANLKFYLYTETNIQIIFSIFELQNEIQWEYFFTLFLDQLFFDKFLNLIVQFIQKHQNQFDKTIQPIKNSIIRFALSLDSDFITDFINLFVFEDNELNYYLTTVLTNRKLFDYMKYLNNQNTFILNILNGKDSLDLVYLLINKNSDIKDKTSLMKICLMNVEYLKAWDCAISMLICSPINFEVNTNFDFDKLDISLIPIFLVMLSILFSVSHNFDKNSIWKSLTFSMINFLESTIDHFNKNDQILFLLTNLTYFNTFINCESLFGFAPKMNKISEIAPISLSRSQIFEQGFGKEFEESKLQIYINKDKCLNEIDSLAKKFQLLPPYAMHTIELDYSNVELNVIDSADNLRKTSNQENSANSPNLDTTNNSSNQTAINENNANHINSANNSLNENSINENNAFNNNNQNNSAKNQNRENNANESNLNSELNQGPTMNNLHLVKNWNSLRQLIQSKIDDFKFAKIEVNDEYLQQVQISAVSTLVLDILSKYLFSFISTKDFIDKLKTMTISLNRIHPKQILFITQRLILSILNECLDNCVYSIDLIEFACKRAREGWFSDQIAPLISLMISLCQNCDKLLCDNLFDLLLSGFELIAFNQFPIYTEIYLTYQEMIFVPERMNENLFFFLIEYILKFKSIVPETFKRLFDLIMEKFDLFQLENSEPIYLYMNVINQNFDEFDETEFLNSQVSLNQSKCPLNEANSMQQNSLNVSDQPIELDKSQQNQNSFNQIEQDSVNEANIHSQNSINDSNQQIEIDKLEQNSSNEENNHKIDLNETTSISNDKIDKEFIEKFASKRCKYVSKFIEQQFHTVITSLEQESLYIFNRRSEFVRLSKEFLNKIRNGIFESHIIYANICERSKQISLFDKDCFLRYREQHITKLNLEHNKGNGLAISLLSNQLYPSKRIERSVLCLNENAKSRKELIMKPIKFENFLDVKDVKINEQLIENVLYASDQLSKLQFSQYFDLNDVFRFQEFELLYGPFDFLTEAEFMYGIEGINGCFLKASNSIIFIENCYIQDNKLALIENLNRFVNNFYLNYFISGEFGGCTLFCGHCVLKWNLKDIVNIIQKLDQKSFVYEFNFISGYTFIIKANLSEILPSLKNTSLPFQTPAISMLKKELTNVTELWSKGFYDNFTYLCYLNMISGRSFCDYSNYPVFPQLFDSFDIFSLRDLKKPMGQINKDRAFYFDSVFERSNRKYFYEDSFMSIETVLSFLIDFQPFNILSNSYVLNSHVQLKKFDFKKSFESLLNVSEVVPQLYLIPEMIQLLKIPVYFDGLSPYMNFYFACQELFESEKVTINLSNWIDLIFGYLINSIEHKNVFSSEKIKANQLFKKPHEKSQILNSNLVKQKSTPDNLRGRNRSLTFSYKSSSSEIILSENNLIDHTKSQTTEEIQVKNNNYLFKNHLLTNPDYLVFQKINHFPIEFCDILFTEDIFIPIDQFTAYLSPSVFFSINTDQFCIVKNNSIVIKISQLFNSALFLSVCQFLNLLAVTHKTGSVSIWEIQYEGDSPIDLKLISVFQLIDLNQNEFTQSNLPSLYQNELFEQRNNSKTNLTRSTSFNVIGSPIQSTQMHISTSLNLNSTDLSTKNNSSQSTSSKQMNSINSTDKSNPLPSSSSEQMNSINSTDKSNPLPSSSSEQMNSINSTDLSIKSTSSQINSSDLSTKSNSSEQMNVIKTKSKSNVINQSNIKHKFGKVLFSPSHFLAICSSDDRVIRFDVGRLRLVDSIHVGYTINNLCIDEYAAQIITCGDSEFTIWTIGGSLIYRQKCGMKVRSIAVSQLPCYVKNRFIVTIHENGFVVFWSYDYKNGLVEILKQRKVSSVSLKTISIDDLVSRVVVSDINGNIYVFDFAGTKRNPISRDLISNCAHCDAKLDKSSKNQFFVCEKCHRYFCGKCINEVQKRMLPIKVYLCSFCYSRFKK